MRTEECQIHCLPRMSVGKAEIPPPSLGRILNLAITRPMSPRTKQKIKKKLNSTMLFLSGQKRKTKASQPATTSEPAAKPLEAGDWVRVRSREEIETTLDYWGELKGCGVLDGQWQYCGTTQRVLKPLKRFLDEREYRMKKCKNIVLLQGVTCEGIEAFGRCDRSCYFFWREEWLEKIDSPSPQEAD